MADGDGNRSDIVFASLPTYLDFLARALVKLDHRVFYLSLASSEKSRAVEGQRAELLRSQDIVPMPLEFLPRLDGVMDSYIDPGNKLSERTDGLAPAPVLQAFARLYPNNTDVVKKLRVAIQAKAAAEVGTVGRMNCWARAHPERGHLLIFPRLSGFLAFDLESNVGLLVLPIDALVKCANLVVRPFRRLVRTFATTTASAHKSGVGHAAPTESKSTRIHRVALVTHQGLNYGDLFQKTLYYSNQIDSELHPHNLLHFDYSGFSSPSENLNWVRLGGERKTSLKSIGDVLIGIFRAFTSVRSLSQAIGLLLLSRFYAAFMSYRKELAAYPSLEMALIDYEILCPTALLLAFNSQNIRTVAVQERFFGAFYETTGGIVLDTYLCGSEYAIELLRKSSSCYVDHYVPVGQYRCDNLVAARKSTAPTILEIPISQGRRIITALGFHTHVHWYNAQSDSLLSWSAHKSFLEDMIQLSKDLPDAFIVLRYKTADWVSLPVFAEVVRQIDSSDNIAIAMDYDKSFYSYDLCGHSDLVIAKHTSLGDECLAAGIPVLFHEYTHNTERLVADAFDYSPARIMCFNYQDLLKRARLILNGSHASMTSDYLQLKTVVFGDLGDGKACERIHAHIELMLKETL